MTDVVEVAGERTEVLVGGTEKFFVSSDQPEMSIVEISDGTSAVVEVRDLAFGGATVVVSGAVDVVTTAIETIVPVEISHAGVSGGGGGDVQEVFVQPTAPVVPDGQAYVWWETGLPGDGYTLWFSDGTP